MNHDLFHRKSLETLFLEEAEKENVPIIPQKIDKNLNRTIDQSLHETLVDTLKTEIDHERSIRLQEQLPLHTLLCIVGTMGAGHSPAFKIFNTERI